MYDLRDVIYVVVMLNVSTYINNVTEREINIYL